MLRVSDSFGDYRSTTDQCIRGVVKDVLCNRSNLPADTHKIQVNLAEVAANAVFPGRNGGLSDNRRHLETEIS